MAKYTFEFKIKVVTKYLNQEGGVKELEDELLKLRIEAAFRVRSKNERTARIISSLRGQFKLKALLSYTGMPKAKNFSFGSGLGISNESILSTP